MSAITVTNASEPARKQRERPISKPVRQAIALLVTGECKTQKAAAERVGLHPDHLCRMLKTPQAQAFAEREARKTIGLGVMRASARLNELVDHQSGHVSFEATKHVLALRGIATPRDGQPTVNVGVSVGYTILLGRKGDDEAQMGHERTIEAKPLIEHESVRAANGLTEKVGESDEC